LQSVTSTCLWPFEASFSHCCCVVPPSTPPSPIFSAFATLQHLAFIVAFSAQGISCVLLGLATLFFSPTVHPPSFPAPQRELLLVCYLKPSLRCQIAIVFPAPEAVGPPGASSYYSPSSPPGEKPASRFPVTFPLRPS